MNTKPTSKQQNIVVQELEKELLVYDLQINKAFCLNETCGLVFRLCDGNRTVLQIADALSVKLKTLVSEDYVRLTLHELKKNGLLENSDEIKTYLNDINRRELVKKIGFASMIALPIISSVVAPSALQAQSCSLLAPGSIVPGNCSDNPSLCTQGLFGGGGGVECCSMSAISVNQPCSFNPNDFACQCV